MSKISVGVVGASGYTGLELIKLLLVHPHFELNYLAATSATASIASIHPSLLGLCDLRVEAMDAKEAAQQCELIFLALPHMQSMPVVKLLLEAEVKVVDLSADYRLKLENYEAFYTTHQDSANLANAVYGLPELNSKAIASANLVANPGCYPTATILATLPFLPYIDKTRPLIVDAKSGVSGAGKKCSEATHFVSINENCYAYNPLKHRHSIEIAEKLAHQEVIFVPHLLPLTRGMLSSVYATLTEQIDALALLQSYYKGNQFIRIREKPPQMKDVAGTNFCDIFAQQEGNTLFMSASIDNITRGASSQAVVNANIMMGLAPEVGISSIAYVP